MAKGTKEKVDLVLLDLLMPKMDGKKLIETYLKESNSDLKIIIASGFSNYDPKEDIQDSRVKGFLTKPFNSVELLTTIRRILDNESNK